MQPSYRTSTLSQLAVGSVGVYLIACLVVSVIVAVTGGDPTLIVTYTNPLKWAAEVFGASYLAVRKNGGTNGVQDPPK